MLGVLSRLSNMHLLRTYEKLAARDHGVIAHLMVKRESFQLRLRKPKDHLSSVDAIEDGISKHQWVS